MVFHASFIVFGLQGSISIELSSAIKMTLAPDMMSLLFSVASKVGIWKFG